jgi:NADH-quinone oxidoreductase subunit L
LDFLQFNPETDYKLLLAVLLIPVLGYVIQIFFGKRIKRGDILLTAGMFISMCIALLMFAKALAAAYGGEEFIHESVAEWSGWGWLYQSEQGINLVVGILYDPLGAAILAAVTVVSFCVHLYSTGYMHGDCRYHIFFANISLFTFAMFGLVLADNLLFLFIFWELMGLMSYLLIGHFSHDGQSGFRSWATWASQKAFMTTRVGDVCLLVGMLMFHQHFETFRFTELWAAAGQTVAANGGEYPAWMTVAGLFIFGGTIGKSAQFPLHIWLPDAMAGPTPVSAMIHAATMVAAGVFLLGRTYPLMSPAALEVITVVGATTALFAATIGMTAWDLKAVLAYSTISQLGFMVAAVGLGSVTAGMFHMTTHAFFKACLFLSAGSVIQGCNHEQDMRLMGGLRKKMPITFVCMLACTMAIAGIPLFSGFYSKDKIIMAGYERVLDHDLFSGAALFGLVALAIAAAMTAFYMFRLIFLTFFGEYRGDKKEHRYSQMLAEHGRGGYIVYHDHHDEGEHAHVPHESPKNITIPLMVLTFLGVFGGHFWLTSSDPLANHTKPWFETMVSEQTLYGEDVAHWLSPEPHGHEAIAHLEHLEHTAHLFAVGTSLTVALLGVFGAWLLYHRRRDIPAKVVAALGPVYRLVANKYYIDEIVNRVVIRPTMALCRGLKWIDDNIVDGLVNVTGRTNRAAGFFHAWFDRVFVDGFFTSLSNMTQSLGSAVRLLQTGRIQQYLSLAVAGSILLVAWLILS